MANNNKHTGPNVPALRFPEFSGEWKKMSLQDCCSDFSYGLNAPAKAYDGVNKYIRITDIDENTSVYKSDDPVSPDGLMSDEYLVNENDILFARTGASTGKTYLYNQNDGRLFYAGFLIKANVNNNCDPYFIFSQTKTQSYRRWVEIMSTRSGQPGINSQEYASYPLYVPSKEEQEKIALLLRGLDKRILVQSKIIEEQETLLRSLRHKIYSKVQAESQCTIADVLCYEQPTKYLVTDTDYTDDDSQVPVLTANKAFILGHTTENFGIYDKGPCIILDDFTLDCKYVDFKFKVKSSAIKILRAKAKTNLRFIFEYFRFLALNTTEHRRHYIAEIEPMSILLPSNEEIYRIARLFTALDERLEAARKELKILESQKMYMLQKMFI